MDSKWDNLAQWCADHLLKFSGRLQASCCTLGSMKLDYGESVYTTNICKPHTLICRDSVYLHCTGRAFYMWFVKTPELGNLPCPVQKGHLPLWTLFWSGGMRWHPDTQTEGVMVLKREASRLDRSPCSAAGAHYRVAYQWAAAQRPCSVALQKVSTSAAKEARPSTGPLGPNWGNLWKQVFKSLRKWNWKTNPERGVNLPTSWLT